MTFYFEDVTVRVTLETSVSTRMLLKMKVHNQ